MPQIAIFNRSSILTNSQVDWMVRAINANLYEHFNKDWGLEEEEWPVVFYKRVDKLPGDIYPLEILDTAPSDGYLGLHTVDLSGRYCARVFVRDILEHGGVPLFDKRNPTGLTVASVIDHEVKELRKDPGANKYIPGPLRPEGDLYALETVDPVQGDIVPQTVRRWGIAQTVGLANYILPSWFDRNNHSGRFDFLGTCPAPFEVARDGYMVVRHMEGADNRVYGWVKPEPWKIEMRTKMERAKARRAKDHHVQVVKQP